MARKVRQGGRGHADSKAAPALRWTTTLPTSVADVDADSVQVALNEWEQLWKHTLRKNENALIRARRKAPRSTTAKR